MPATFSAATRRAQARRAQQIAATFHDLERLHHYQVCCAKYSPLAIQKAFRKARNAAPARRKKSRAALFFYLVKHYAHHTTDHSLA